MVRIESDSVFVSVVESQGQESAKGAAQEVVRRLVFLCEQQHHREGRKSCRAPLHTVGLLVIFTCDNISWVVSIDSGVHAYQI